MKVTTRAWTWIPVFAGMTINFLAPGDARAQSRDVFETPRTEDIPILYQALGNRAYRLRAIDALTRVGKPAVPVLVRALNDRELRGLVIDRLGTLGADAEIAVPTLIRLLGDAETSARFRAADALLRIGKPAVPALVRALRVGKDVDGAEAAQSRDRTDPAVRKAARNLAQALLGSAAKAPEPDAAKPKEEPKPKDEPPDAVGAGLLGMGPEAQEALTELMKALRQEDEYASGTAAEALNKVRPAAKEVAIAVYEALNEDDPEADEPDPELFEKIGPASMVTAEVLIEAIRTRAEGPPGSDEEALLRLRPLAREASRLVLRAIRRPEREPVETLKELGPAARQVALVLMDVLKTRESDTQTVAKPPPPEGAANKDAPVTQDSPVPPPQQEGPASVPALPTVRPSLVQAPAREPGAGDPGGEPLDRLRREAQAAATIPALHAARQDEEIRMRTVGILGQIGSEARDALPALLEVRKDPDVRLRQAAEEAIRRIDPNALPPAAS